MLDVCVLAETCVETCDFHPLSHSETHKNLGKTQKCAETYLPSLHRGITINHGLTRRDWRDEFQSTTALLGGYVEEELLSLEF